MPLIAVQANSSPEYIPVLTAFLSFSQTFGSAVFLTAANAIFNNRLASELARRVPDISKSVIIAAGATGIRDVVPKDRLLDVIGAYTVAVNSTYYLSVGAGVAMFGAAWLMGWNDVRKKPAAAGGMAAAHV